LIGYFIGNISAKKIEMRSRVSKLQQTQRWDVFLLTDVARKCRMMAALPNTGVALCRMLASKSRKCRCCGNFGPISGGKKRHAILVNCKLDVYEARQLWLEKFVVEQICFSFSICSLVFKLHEF